MSCKEIGGYLELDKVNASVYHDDAIALNSGRSALRYVINAKKIRKLYLPFFCCDSVIRTCQNEEVEFECYNIDYKFRPIFDKEIKKEEGLYIVNIYGQIKNKEFSFWKKQYRNLIIDNAQAYFQKPLTNVDTLYTCRKYFGVPDGGFLYTNQRLGSIEQCNSSNRMKHILGRFEYSANEYYFEYKHNEDVIANQPLQIMSKLTDNLLRRIDYKYVMQKRNSNYSYLHKHLKTKNILKLSIPNGAYMYPFYCYNGELVRKLLQSKKIYIPTLWPGVFDICNVKTLEYDYAKNILPLPVDQRYSIEDMQYILVSLNEILEGNND